MKRKIISKRFSSLVLTFAMLFTAVPVSYASGNSSNNKANGILFYSDFSDASLAGLEGDALAKALFGEGNYILGHGATDATMKIENGALRIIGDDNKAPTDGTTKNNRTQILLANDEDISEKGVVIECDYTFNSGCSSTSGNAFAFVSKPVDTSLKYIESDTVWFSSIYSY